MSILNFPSIGIQVDRIIKEFWKVIENLPDETSVSSIISALEIVKFDVIEQMRTK